MKKTSNIDRLIDDVESQMLLADPTTEEYQTLLMRLNSLSALKAKKPEKNLDVNTLVIVGGNLLGIIAILAYESRHIVTSKAMGFIIKPKLK